jgi:60 kDa SS-A/Ro ribonucleoprotein
MATRYTQHFSTQQTPQSEPIPGEEQKQVQNSAGGFSYPVDDWKRLERFLILGSQGGSYYASEHNLTKGNADAVLRCIKADGPRALALTVGISMTGRAPKHDPAVFVLAMCLKMGDPATRRLAVEAVPKVCRIGTHIFQLAESVKAFGGWGRTTRKAFSGWYASQTASQLALNLVKYQQRGGWSHRDVLRKCHGKSPDASREALYRWATAGSLDARSVKRLVSNPAISKDRRYVARTDTYPACDGLALPPIVSAFEELRKATEPAKAVRLIQTYALPRECVPTELLNSTDVWDALLRAGDYGMPYTALIRNLGKMTSIGLLSPMSAAESYVVDRLANREGLRRARVHPITILLAQSVFAAGHGVKGSLRWDPSQRIVDALNDAFYALFEHVEATGKRTLLALDVSRSMDIGNVAGTPLTPRQCVAALALVTARTERQYGMLAFSDRMVPVPISPKTRLDDAVHIMERIPMGGTDCAIPMGWALHNRVEVDVFEIYTDSETWCGNVHPMQALRAYRKATGIPAKLIVAGVVSNGFTIADPDDAGCLDVVGFDAAAPAVMADFVRG